MSQIASQSIGVRDKKAEKRGNKLEISKERGEQRKR